MPNRLKTNLSSSDLIKFFSHYGFELGRTKGSHMVIKRKQDGIKQVLVIPNHKIITRGILKGIINQAEVFISIETLQKFFYTE